MEPQLSLTLTAVLSGIALVASVLSPVLTTIFTNRHQRKMLEIEFYMKHRAEAIEQYLSSAGAAIRDHTLSNLAEFGRHSGEAYLYFPAESIGLVEQLNLALYKKDFDAALNHYESLCKELSKQPPRGKKKQRGHRNV